MPLIVSYNLNLRGKKVKILNNQKSVIKKRKPQASDTFVSSETPGLSRFRSYLGHGALSSQKSTTGGFLGGKLG